MSKDSLSTIFKGQENLREVLDSVQELILILDSNRKIVFYNTSFGTFAKEHNLKTELGISPGEAFNCVNFVLPDTECGDSNFCKYCGGNQSIKVSQNGKKTENPCRIASLEGNAFDISIHASPIEIQGEAYTFYSLLDKSAISRKQMLERIFFHDVNNVVNIMTLILDNVKTDHEQNNLLELSDKIDLMNSALQTLRNEIDAQYILSMAEKDELTTTMDKIQLHELIANVCNFFNSHSLTTEVKIINDAETNDCVLYSDPTLLNRVLVNTVKNACEASDSEQVVNIGFESLGDHVRIYVHNESFMNEEVSSSIFKRSFSTKGTGHGIGTYSMRLLTEKYLKGKISFTTSKDEGTTFQIMLPIKPPYQQ
ncbi:MAG: hypothetical protein C0603_00380 [Denitrovibrio sp.]|nr:MAG: hypothetical protein C0603_00380 [Denitrovibrio sp.]